MGAVDVFWMFIFAVLVASGLCGGEIVAAVSAGEHVVAPVVCPVVKPRMVWGVPPVALSYLTVAVSIVALVVVISIIRVVLLTARG